MTRLAVVLGVLVFGSVPQNASFSAVPPVRIETGFGAGAYRPGNGIKPPSPRSQVQPKYTANAMRQRIVGSVELDVVVREDGTVGAIRIARSLDQVFGLDDQAVAAAKQWQFSPATDPAGTPVPIVVRLVLTFRLHDNNGEDLPESSAPAAEFAQGACSETEPFAQAPKAVRIVEAQYTADATRAKIQGNVAVDARVEKDGHVSGVRVTNSLDALTGLDQAARQAALESTFVPNSGECNGVVAPVIVHLDMAFRLH